MSPCRESATISKAAGTIRRGSEMKAISLTALLLAGLLVGVPGRSSAQSGDRERQQAIATLDRLAKATVEKDVVTLSKLYHADLVFVHTSSQTQNKTEVLKDAPTRPIAKMEYRNVVAH